MKLEVLEKTPMDVVQVKQALERIQKGTEELNFRAAKSLEYAQDFAKLKPKEAAELAEKLKALEIPRLRDAHVHKLIDLLPKSEKQVKMILTSANLTVSNESVKKIADTIKEFC